MDFIPLGGTYMYIPRINLSKKLLNKVNVEAVSNHGYCLLFFWNKGGFKWN